MNTYFAVAGALAILLGLFHSVVGEYLLIGRLTRDGLPPLTPFTLFEVPRWGLTGSKEFALRTLRFSWHLPTLLGAGLGAILLRLAWPALPEDQLTFIRVAAGVSCLGCSLVVLTVSGGKHPGWVGFLVIAALIWLG